MKLWSKIASTFLMAACLSVGQTVPASDVRSAPPVSPSSGSEPAVASGVAAPARSTACPPGQPAWLCVSQTLQQIMFNPDGTHRADADIAKDAPRAIAELIGNGVMKPQDAPSTPIGGFDDANKFVNNYPSSPAPSSSSSAPAAPVSTKPAPCPADRPWLCESSALSKASPAKSTSASGTGSPKKAEATAKASAAGKIPAATAPKAPSVGADTPLYILGPNDVVGVTVFDERNVPGTYAIGPDGRISMPLIGNFRAVGMTLPQLTELIAQKLRDEGGILEPIVNVQLLRSNSKQFTLIGGVGRAGPIQLLRETTILDALAGAGFKDFANKKKIVLRRGTKDFRFNYNEVIKGIHPEQNITIEDGDIIIVPE